MTNFDSTQRYFLKARECSLSDSPIKGWQGRIKNILELSKLYGGIQFSTELEDLLLHRSTNKIASRVEPGFNQMRSDRTNCSPRLINAIMTMYGNAEFDSFGLAREAVPAMMEGNIIITDSPEAQMDAIHDYVKWQNEALLKTFDLYRNPHDRVPDSILPGGNSVFELSIGEDTEYLLQQHGLDFEGMSDDDYLWQKYIFHLYREILSKKGVKLAYQTATTSQQLNLSCGTPEQTFHLFQTLAKYTKSPQGIDHSMSMTSKERYQQFGEVVTFRTEEMDFPERLEQFRIHGSMDPDEIKEDYRTDIAKLYYNNGQLIGHHQVRHPFGVVLKRRILEDGKPDYRIEIRFPGVTSDPVARFQETLDFILAAANSEFGQQDMINYDMMEVPDEVATL